MKFQIFRSFRDQHKWCVKNNYKWQNICKKFYKTCSSIVCRDLRIKSGKN